MRTKTIGISFFILITVCISSCNPQKGSDDEILETTIQAAIAATETVENAMDDQISEAVSATLTAIPTPTPVAVDQFSEEEFAAAIEQSTGEAVSAADEAATYADSASNDGELTQGEIDELVYLYYWSINELEQALYLVDLYYDAYGELLENVITNLESIEDELQAVLMAAEDVIAYLEEFSEIISKGQQIAQEKMDQFNALSTAISENSSILTSQLPAWIQSRGDEFNRIVNNALSTQPDAIAESKLGAIQIARQYVDQVKLAVGDGKFSLLELQSLSQLGANAAASLGQFGGEFSALPNMINGITGNFARGQLPQLNASIESLQGAISAVR